MENKHLLTLNILSQLYGYKKIQIISYICENIDDDFFLKKTYKQIMEELQVSKPTLVSMFTQLKNAHILQKEKNGLYRLKIKEMK